MALLQAPAKGRLPYIELSSLSAAEDKLLFYIRAIELEDVTVSGNPSKLFVNDWQPEELFLMYP